MHHRCKPPNLHLPKKKKLRSLNTRNPGRYVTGMGSRQDEGAGNGGLRSGRELCSIAPPLARTANPSRESRAHRPGFAVALPGRSVRLGKRAALGTLQNTSTRSPTFDWGRERRRERAGGKVGMTRGISCIDKIRSRLCDGNELHRSPRSRG